MKKTQLLEHIDFLVALELQSKKRFENNGNRNLASMSDFHIKTLAELKDLALQLNSLD